MKTIIFSALTIILFNHGVFAQDSNVPRTEFTIGLSAKELEVKPGETKDIQINLIRSKSYTKSKATLGLSSALPEGVKISYEPAEGHISGSQAKIEVSETAKPGTYLLMLNCTMQHKSKGTMLKLIVKESTSVVRK